MGVYNATVITNAGQNLIASAIAGGQAINFTAVKTSTHVYPAGTALQNLTSLSDVKQTVAPTSVDVYNNNVVQISARVPNTGIATAYLINTIGLFGSAGGAETLIAVLTAQTPDEVPVFDAEAPAAFIFNIQMTIQNADEVVFEVNDTGTATVADLNRVAQPFSGATASAAGSGGRVPAPAAGDDGKFLRGDATWTAPADMVEAFTSSDVADGGATAWTGVNPLTSGETNKSIFAKLSQMFKNIRYLYKMLGTTDISSIGDGTVTKALSVLNANQTPKRYSARGKIANNTPDVLKCYGAAEVFILGTRALVFYTFKVSAVSTNTSDFSYGLNRDLLQTANPNIPYITPISGGTATVYNTSGQIDSGINQYGMFHDASGQFWPLARLADTAGTTGAWPVSKLTAGITVKGIAIGNVSS